MTGLAATSTPASPDVSERHASVPPWKRKSKEIGQNALTTNGIGESPLMYWVEWLAGVENAHFLLMDHQEDVENLFDAMQTKSHRKHFPLLEPVNGYPFSF